VSDDASLNISSKSELFFGDDFINDGVINNLGDIYVAGDITNTGQYQSVGKMFLLGYNQTVSMNGDTVNNLYVQGSGNKYLISDIYVASELYFDNGIVVPTSNSKMIVLDEAQTSVGSDFSYVLGYLYNQGTGTKYYPVGTATTFLPVELHNIVGDSLTIGMRANDFESAPIPGKGTRLLSQTNYWTQDVYTGELEYAQITLPTYLVGNTGFYTEDSIVVAMSDNVLGPYRSQGKDENITSIIPYEYVSSIDLDTANRTYYTLAMFYDVNWNLFYVPNALSHNATDIDDQRVRIYGNLFQEKGFSFTVKNQWGNVVYKTSSLIEMEPVKGK
jgi:hypothetical protein